MIPMKTRNTRTTAPTASPNRFSGSLVRSSTKPPTRSAVCTLVRSPPGGCGNGCYRGPNTGEGTPVTLKDFFERYGVTVAVVAMLTLVIAILPGNAPDAVVSELG